MKNNPVKIGVVGVGHLGQHHVKHYKVLKNVKLVGIFDTDKKRASQISNEYQITAFDELHSLIKEVDAMSIVVNTRHHAAVAESCIKHKSMFLLKNRLLQRWKKRIDYSQLLKKMEF